MRCVVCLACYVLGVLAFGGLLAYPVYAVLALVGIALGEFHEFTLRFTQLLALVGLWPVLVALGLSGSRAWGFGATANGSRFWIGVLAGLVAGVLMLLVLIALLVTLGVRVVPGSIGMTASAWVALLTRAIAAALVVAVVEEIWFRGALHSSIRSSAAPLVAVVGVAALYAAVHFVRADTTLDEAQLGWSSGLVVITHAFHRFEPPAIIDSFAALFAAGALLGLVRHRTGRIAECIGVHAGWVLVIRLARETTVTGHDARFAWLVGDFDGVIGWAAFAWFVVLALVYYWAGARQESPR